MKLSFLILLFFYSNFLSAQVNPGASDGSLINLIRQNRVNEGLDLISREAALNPPSSANQKWQIKFEVSFSGPANGLERSYVDTSSIPGNLQNIIHNAIRETDHEKRKQLIREQCLGTNLNDKFLMASFLGSWLSNIYDYERTKEGTPQYNEVVTTSMQWDAMRAVLNGSSTERRAAGVCRDAASTLAEFLVHCGIPAEMVFIDSYRTPEVGHQIVTLRDSDNRHYSINWSEVFKTESSNPAINATPYPNILNLGLAQTRFNSSGRVVGQRNTSVGALLNKVAGGVNDDPLYNPSINQVLASYYGVGVGGFYGQTENQQKVVGAILGYERNVLKWLYINGSGVYANNQFDYSTSANDQEPWQINQHILYGRILVLAEPVFNLQSESIGQFNLRPRVGFEAQGAVFYSDIVDREEVAENYDYVMQGHVGGVATWRSPRGNVGVYVQSQTLIGVEESVDNTRNGNVPALFHKRTFVRAQIDFRKRLLLGYQLRADVWNMSHTASFGVQFPRSNLRLTSGVAIYHYPHANPQSIVLFNAEKMFKLSGVNMGVSGNVQFPILNGHNSLQQTLFNLRLSITPQVKPRRPR